MKYFEGSIEKNKKGANGPKAATRDGAVFDLRSLDCTIFEKVYYAVPHVKLLSSMVSRKRLVLGFPH